MTRVVVLAMFALSCGGLSVSEFQKQATDAKACDVNLDTCRNAGAAQCLCPTPVNSARAAAIDELAKQVACGGAQVECVQMLNPRCLNGTCVATSTP